MEKRRYLAFGDSALAVEFGNTISPCINQSVLALKRAVEQAAIAGIIETVPTYCSLLIHYDPTVILYQELVNRLRRLRIDRAALRHSTEVIELPVCYGGEYGPDLAYVAEYHRMTPQEVIARHSSTDYLVYMLGFIAGFPYLGGMDEALATPRLDVPRTCIERGSVGIAGKQTGVYPMPSPGGWQLIGRTPVRLCDFARQSVSLLYAGCYVHFSPIDAAEYQKIAQADAEGRYCCRTWQKEA